MAVVAQLNSRSLLPQVSCSCATSLLCAPPLAPPARRNLCFALLGPRSDQWKYHFHTVLGLVVLTHHIAWSRLRKIEEKWVDAVFWNISQLYDLCCGGKFYEGYSCYYVKGEPTSGGVSWSPVWRYGSWSVSRLVWKLVSYSISIYRLLSPYICQ